MAYGDFKDLKRRTQSDKAIKDKAFKITSNPKYDGYQREIASIASREIASSFLIINNQLLGSLKKERYILLLKTIFGVLI